VQGGLLYTISPVHTLEAYIPLARRFVDMGADSIALKDMAGMMSPYDAGTLIARLKAELPVPVEFHAHCTSDMGTAALMKAAEAGADIVDTAISAFSGFTSQPPTETVVSIFRGTPRDTGLDLGLLADIAEQCVAIRKKYAQFESGLIGVDVNVLQFQVPGGMLSNLVSQLREQHAEDRYQEVLQEVPRVRAELGYPPLATPSSQIVGTQATLNVLTGERYKVVLKEVRDYVRGLYGRPPGPIDPAVKRLAIGDEEPIQVRPADLLQPGYEQARREIGDLARSEEDVITYALFPQVARPFFEQRARGAGDAEERAAAVAAVLAAQRARVQTPSRESIPRPFASPWKTAARQRSLHRATRAR
jgi:oxaloacetate decarboxylase alpha subunit